MSLKEMSLMYVFSHVNAVQLAPHASTSISMLANVLHCICCVINVNNRSLGFHSTFISFKNNVVHAAHTHYSVFVHSFNIQLHLSSHVHCSTHAMNPPK